MKEQISILLLCAQDDARARELLMQLDKSGARVRTAPPETYAETLPRVTDVHAVVVFAQDASTQVRAQVKQMRMLTTLPIVLLLPFSEGDVRIESNGIYYMPCGPNESLQLLAAQLKLKIRIVLTNAALARTASTTGEKAGDEAIARSFVPNRQDKRLIAIGASAGGVQAIEEVLRALPDTLPGIVITQHMPPGFVTQYAQRLDKICAMHVMEGAHNQRVEPGSAYIAPGGMHMRVAARDGGYYLQIADGEKVSGHRPSVDVLFESVARSVGKYALGVILTGMGEDGADGLLKMRQAGAQTIGQDEETSCVYGMPRVAFLSGAVCRQAGLPAIPKLILEYVSH